ncbi:MAG: thiamine phosphate synthase, partial [bacterium]|nr:thiamine phosphate synthase [bacterium]
MADQSKPNFSWIERSRLWLVLDRYAAAPRSLPEITELCIEGGVDVVVFRMKDVTSEDARPVAKAVREICSEHNVLFVLSHFSELVTELRPDALHIGISDDPVMSVRKSLSDQVALGYSAHSIVEAERANADGADYVVLGPIFETSSKAHYGPPLGVSVIAEAETLDVPVVYIGGMNEQTIP